MYVLRVASKYSELLAIAAAAPKSVVRRIPTLMGAKFLIEGAMKGDLWSQQRLITVVLLAPTPQTDQESETLRIMTEGEQALKAKLGG